MTPDEMTTVTHGFAALVATRADAPFITFYDDATGERAELSGSTLANWVAKTANLLIDGLGLVPGDRATVRLDPHWQTAAVLLGCWVAGLTVDLTGSGAPVAFVAEPVEPLPPADEVYALALAPFGMPFRGDPPVGTLDFITEMRPYGDALPPLATRPGQVAIAPSTTHADLVRGARAPLPPRVLIDADEHQEPEAWLVAPLLARCSIVLCRNLDAAKLADRLTTERAVQL